MPPPFYLLEQKRSRVFNPPIYNRVIQNRKAGKYTHVYIDEVYLFFANGSGSGHGINN